MTVHSGGMWLFILAECGCSFCTKWESSSPYGAASVTGYCIPTVLCVHKLHACSEGEQGQRQF